MPKRVTKEGTPTPTITVELMEGKKPTTVLELFSVPEELYNEIISQYEKAAAFARPGLPTMAIKTDHLKICFPTVETALPDWIRYEINRDGDFTDVGKRSLGEHQLPIGDNARAAAAGRFTNRSVVLLLESPHVEEMEFGQPASGSTGLSIDQRRGQFQRMLQPMIERLCSETKWETIPFIIANPCPYPASCLANLNKWPRFRDLVFDRLFPRVADDFRHRLQRYNPLTVINACTDAAPEGYFVTDGCGSGLAVVKSYATKSPKALVNEQLQIWTDKRCFERQFLKDDSSNKCFSPKAKPKTVRCGPSPVKGYWVDIAHPSSWRS